MARAALVAGDRPVAIDDLPEEVLSRRHTATVSARDLRDDVASLERRRIEDALARTNGSQTHAAVLLGMPRRTRVARLGEYGIERRRDATTRVVIAPGTCPVYPSDLMPESRPVELPILRDLGSLDGCPAAASVGRRGAVQAGVPTRGGSR